MILKQFAVGKNDAGQTLTRFLTKQGLTIGVIRKALRNKDIKINDKRGKADDKLIQNDSIKVFLKENLYNEKKEDYKSPKFHGISTKLQIIYEDGNILLADKPVGLLCHDGTDNLINRIKAYLYKKGEFNPENENSFEPALCNRIDRNTGGIVIAAKNAESLRVMNEKIKQRLIKKLYLCILTSVPQQKEATLTAFLEKDETTNTVKITAHKTSENKTIVTKYRILKEKNGLALAEIDLLTGRTHQIRAHMAYIGCPLLGDGKYGRNRINKQYGVTKQALYSYKLMFSFDDDQKNTHLDYLNGRSFEAGDIWFLGIVNK
ncbi:MAG: RluA family pseudouridine synthase [Oscillospiraceae bacterium]|nr:RluA family pseudouridine synthase [Oscillospiraceae bacterium]